MAHGDYTGQQKAVLAQRYAEQQKLAANQLTLVSQVVAEASKETIDLNTEEDNEAREAGLALTDPDDPESEVIVVDSEDPSLASVQFRASDTVEDITIGKDRVLNIQQGQNYTAPRWVVDHLDEKQLVWH